MRLGALDVQLRAARADVDEARSYGVDASSELWGPDRVSGVAGALGASFDPACARLHPAKLVRASPPSSSSAAP